MDALRNDLATQRPPGINTYSWIWTEPAHACLSRLSARGYREFELLVNPPHLSLDRGTAEHAALRKLLAGGEVVVRSVNLPSLDTNLASVFAEMRAHSVAMFRKALELCASLEAPYLITVPGRVSPLFPPGMDLRNALMRESIEALLPEAERLGVRLALENVPFAAFPDAASLVAFVRGMGSPWLSITYDVANAHFIGEEPAEGLETVKDHLAVVHFSDTTRQAWRHDTIGMGDVDFAAACRALDTLGYGGPLMLEVIDREADTAIAASHLALMRYGFLKTKGFQAP